MKRRFESIIYLNFSPYENAGRILDFLVERFETVVFFVFSFHDLGRKRRSNLIRIYEQGTVIKEIKLAELPTPEALLFLTLPLITILIAIQTLYYMLRFRLRHGRFDIYLSVNAFTSWIGNRLRRLGVVSRTIFWVWDYYPPGYPDWPIRLARWGYWQFDKSSSRDSTTTIFLNRRLMTLRQEIGVLPKDRQYAVIPIGTNPGQIEINEVPIIGHLGVLKKSQGLDLLFRALPTLLQKIPALRVEVVGSGPDIAYFKRRARQFKNVTWHGFIQDENKLDAVIRRWSLGLATYRPEPSNPAYWTDPSKIKAYLSQGVPVVTTNIATMATEVQRHGAGLIVPYEPVEPFVDSCLIIIHNLKTFKKNALALAQKYEYHKLYNLLIR